MVLSLVAVGTVFHGVALTIMFLYSEQQPFKARQALLLTITIMANAHLVITHCLEALSDQPPCVLSLFLRYSFSILICGVYILRAIVLYWKFEAVAQKLEFHSVLKTEAINHIRTQKATIKQSHSFFSSLSKYSISSKLSAMLYSSQGSKEEMILPVAAFEKVEERFWFLRHNFLLKPKWQLTVFLIFVVTALLPVLIEIPLVDGPKSTCNFSISNFLPWIYYVLAGITIVILAIRLRTPAFIDTFGLKWELLLTMITTFITFAGFSILEYALRRRNPLLATRIGFLRSWTLSMITTGISCFEALYHYHRKQREFSKFERMANLSRQRRAGKFAIQTLEEFLVNPSGFKAFEEYCKKEFCVENLLFWRDAKAFESESQKMHSMHGQGCVSYILQEAYDLYGTYIAEVAALQVNLPDEIVFDIRRVLRIGKDDTLLIEAGAEGKSLGGITVVGTVRKKSSPQVIDLASSPIKSSFGESLKGVAGTDSESLALEESKTNDESRFSKQSRPSFLVSPSAGAPQGIASLRLVTRSGRDINADPNDLELEIPDDIDIDAAEVVSVYEKAVDEILSLMARDTFRRFRIEPKYKEVVNQIRRTQRALTDMDIV